MKGRLAWIMEGPLVPDVRVCKTVRSLAGVGHAKRCPSESYSCSFVKNKLELEQLGGHFNGPRHNKSRK